MGTVSRDRSSRDRVLGAVRQAVSAGGPTLPPPPPDKPLWTAPPTDTATLIADFRRELDALKGEWLETSAGLAGQQLRALLAELGAKQYIGWLPDDLSVPGLDALFRQARIQRVDAHLSTVPGVRQRRLAELADVPVGLTGADAAIAQVGALIHRSGPQRPRLATLLPPVHIVLVTPNQFHPTVAAFYAHVAETTPVSDYVRAQAHTVWIAGPSRTSDIERVLTLGVHGPGRLIVMLVNP